MFVCLLDELILGFCYSDFDIGNRRIWTRIWTLSNDNLGWKGYLNFRQSFNTIFPKLGYSMFHLEALKLHVIFKSKLFFRHSHDFKGLSKSKYWPTKFKPLHVIFFIRKFFIKKWASKPQNFKKMLRKSPASIAWAAIFENADFS